MNQLINLVARTLVRGAIYKTIFRSNKIAVVIFGIIGAVMMVVMTK